MNREELIELAGSRVFERGEEYAAWRRVRAMFEHNGKIGATVEGARGYRVLLRLGGGRIEHECDCPEGHAGRFCKHSVAVGLNWLNQRTGGDLPETLRLKDLGRALAQLPPDVLTDFLLEEAVGNAGIGRRLLLRAARALGRKPDLDEYTRLLECAAEAAALAEEAGPLLLELEEALNSLLEAGYADETARLIEEAPLFSQASLTGARQEIIGRLQAIHHQALERLAIPADALTHRLSRWQTEESEWTRRAQDHFEAPDAEARDESPAAELESAGEMEAALELARRRVKTCPDDALHIYKRLVTQHANRKNDYAYRQAIELLRRIRQLMTRLKRRDEFFAYVEKLRMTHRSQRNFVKRLDQLLVRSARKH